MTDQPCPVADCPTRADDLAEHLYDAHSARQLATAIEQLAYRCESKTDAIRALTADCEILGRERQQAAAERDDARMWARHGYEIGQRSCTWSDQGVAPAWLTDGWPPLPSDLVPAEALRAERDRLAAAVQRARDLHQPVDAGIGPSCEVCSNHGDINWPCATIRALGGPAAPAERVTPCSEPDPCTDGALCDAHATEQAHAAGDHEWCGVTCEAKFPSDQMRNFIIAKGYPGTAGALNELLRRAAAGTSRPAAPANSQLPTSSYQISSNPAAPAPEETL